jgi:hypothetical protein
MSRLSRAREAFRGAMTATLEQHGIPRQHIFHGDATPGRRVSAGVIS